MGDALGKVSSVLGGARSLVHVALGRKGAATGADPRPLPLVERAQAVMDQLDAQGILGEDTLVFVAEGGNRVVVDVTGRLVSSSLFERVKAPYALFASGTYALEYARQGKPLRASIDDMAQLFGPVVPCGEVPRASLPAFLVRDRGYVVTGRYAGELVAAAILMEKACRVELLAPAVGEVHRLNPALCMAEHAVYLASYSKHEREASDGR